MFLSRNKKSATSEIPAVLPQHIAMIMDGNGRWAKSRGLTIDQLLDERTVSLDFDIDCAVVAILHKPFQSQLHSTPVRKPSVSDTLHESVHRNGGVNIRAHKQ